MTTVALPPTGVDALRAEVDRWQQIAAHATALRWDVPGVPGTAVWVQPVPGGWAVLRTGALTAHWWTDTGWVEAATDHYAARMPLSAAVAVAGHLVGREEAEHAAWTPRLAARPVVHEDFAEYASKETAA